MFKKQQGRLSILRRNVKDRNLTSRDGNYNMLDEKSTGWDYKDQ